MTDGDDIVARLERLAKRAETSKTYVQEFRMMRAEGVADLIHEAMSEIVDLRAQLFNEQEARKDGNV
jgi:hypothetical protein